MSRRAYKEDGADEDWNTVADPTFDPTSAKYAHTDSPAPRGRRGRGGGGRRGRAAGGMGGGRVAHPEGELVATPSRSRGVVSDNCMTLHLDRSWELGWRLSGKNHNIKDTILRGSSLNPLYHKHKYVV